MTFGCMSAIGPEMGRRRPYNVTSLPEQFEVFHNYYQHDSAWPTGRMVPSTVGEKARAIRETKSGDIAGEDSRRGDSRFSGLYLAYKTDNSVNIPYSSATERVRA